MSYIPLNLKKSMRKDSFRLMLNSCPPITKVPHLHYTKSSASQNGRRISTPEKARQFLFPFSKKGAQKKKKRGEHLEVKNLNVGMAYQTARHGIWNLVVSRGPLTGFAMLKSWAGQQSLF